MQRLAQPEAASPSIDSKTNTVTETTGIQRSTITSAPAVQNIQRQEAPELERQAEEREEESIQRKPIFDSPGVGDEQVQRKCASCEAGEEGMVQRIVKPTQAIGSLKLPTTVQRKCASCETEEGIQPKRMPAIQRSGDGSLQASDDFSSRLQRSKGGGSPMSSDTRSSMEGAMGADFSGVRVHTGSEAASLSNDIGAQAFTHGSDVYFNEDKYDPGSSSGQHLLAHELTHTVQQGGAVVQPKQNIPVYKQLKNEPESKKLYEHNLKIEDDPKISSQEESINNQKLKDDSKQNIDEPKSKPKKLSNRQNGLSQKSKQPKPNGLKSEKDLPSTKSGKQNKKRTIEYSAPPNSVNGIDVKLNNSNSSNYGHSAQITLDFIKSQANTKIALVRTNARSGRQRVFQLYANARIETENLIDSCSGELESLILSKQLEAGTLESNQSALLSSEGEKSKVVVNQEKETSETRGNELNASKSEKAQTELGNKSNEAKQEGQNKAGQESGGILGRLKNISFVRLGMQLANKIASGITTVINTVSSYISNAISKIVSDILKIFQALSSIISSVLSLTKRFFNSIFKAIDSLRSSVLPRLSDLKANTINKLIDTQEGVLGIIDESEVEIIQQIEGLLLGAKESINEVVTEIPEDEEPNDDDPFFLALENISKDLVGVFEDITQEYLEFITRQEQNAEETISETLSELASRLVSFKNQGAGTLSSIIGAFGQVLSALGGKVINIFSGIVSTVQNGVKSFFTETNNNVDAGVSDAQEKANQLAYSSEAYSTAGSKTSSWLSTQSLSNVAKNVANSVSSFFGIQRKSTSSSFWSGVGNELLETVVSLFLLVVGLLVISCIPVIGAPIAVIIAAGLIIWGLVKTFVDIWNRMDAAGDPLWVKIVFVIPLGIADLIGILPLLEGIVGRDWISWKKLTPEERGKRVTRGIIDLVLTFATFGIGRAAKAGAVGAKGAKRASKGAKALRKFSVWFRRTKAGRWLRKLASKWGKPKKPTPPSKKSKTPPSKGKEGKLSEILEESKPGRKTKGRAKQYEKQGGYEKAKSDFEKLNPENVKEFPGGKTGELKDGSRVTVRKHSTDSRPTLEIKKGKNVTKIRYGE